MKNMMINGPILNRIYDNVKVSKEQKESNIHNAFENAGATLSGVETAYRVLKKKGKITDNYKFKECHKSTRDRKKFYKKE